MIPESGRKMIDLHLHIARETPIEDYAEESLKAAEAMFSYACSVNHLSPAEYSNELVMTKLIRAQRKNRAAAQS
jgi:hypothetical protein